MGLRTEKGEGEEEGESLLDFYLNNMVLEADVLLLLARSILNIQYADEIRSPTAHQAIEDLKHNAGGHAHLGERVGQGKQNLSHLHPHLFEHFISTKKEAIKPERIDRDIGIFTGVLGLKRS